MHTSSIASTNVSVNQEDYSSLAKKMKKIELMLSSLKEDQEDEMEHLQSLIQKGQQVQDRAKTRINQCEQLKDFMKAPNDKIPSFLIDKQLKPSKGFSLQTRKKQIVQEQVPYMRMNTSVSPDVHHRFRKIQTIQQKNLPKLKTFEHLKKQNRLQQLAEMVHNSIQGMKHKQPQKTSRVKIDNTKFKQSEIRTGIHSRVSKISNSNISQKQTSKTRQPNNITIKLIVLFALGLLVGLFTYF